MCMIIWNTDVNAPGCPGEILEVRPDGRNGRSVLVHTDWDYPGVAGSFGWSLRLVQRCAECGRVSPITDETGDEWACECDGRERLVCDHRHTDGTVDCPDCGTTAGDFIGAAREWLDNNDGAEADDPGYFSEEA